MRSKDVLKRARVGAWKMREREMQGEEEEGDSLLSE